MNLAEKDVGGGVSNGQLGEVDAPRTGQCTGYGMDFGLEVYNAGCGTRMANRKWRETKQQPGTAGPGNMLGCCLIYVRFLWGKLSTRTVLIIC